MKRLFVFGLLLCIGVILIGLMPMARYQSSNRSRVLQTRTVIKDLRIALEAYMIEYGHFPGQSAIKQTADARLLSTGPLIDSLLGKNAEWNPKEIKFIDLPAARNGKFGYIPAEALNPCRMVDLWGNPYVILLDTNGDKKVHNPDIKNSDPAISQSETSPPPAFLPFEVAIYSFGKDGIGVTDDDLVTWRSTREPREASGMTWFAAIALILLGLIVVIVRRQRITSAK